MSIQSVIMRNHENVFNTHKKKPGFFILGTLIIFMFFNKGRLAKQIVVIIDKRKRSLQQATLWNKVQNRTKYVCYFFYSFYSWYC